MQIELLETFLDLIETGSFNRTADRLGVTQSTVSGRVAALEATLGARLFARSKAGTSPTPAGKRFFDHAIAMRHEWNEARRAVQASANPQRSLRIGMQNDLAGSHIGEWVSQFRKALPDKYEVTLNMNADSLDQAVMDGSINLDIVGDGVEPAAQGTILPDPELKAQADNAEREALEHARYRAVYDIDLDDRSPYDLVLDSSTESAATLADQVIARAQTTF